MSKLNQKSVSCGHLHNTITRLYTVHPKYRPKGISYKDITGKKHAGFGKLLH